MILVYLTCASDTEAKIIGHHLLEQKLVACVHRSPVESSYWWKEKVENRTEIKLTMETIADKFDTIVREATRLHSYDEPVLLAVEVTQTTPQVLAWLKESTD